MRGSAFVVLGLLAGALAFAGPASMLWQGAVAQESQSVVEVGSPVEEGSAVFSEEEVRSLVAPIALYPDELLAIILPAATNPLQVVQAGRYLEKYAADKSLQPDPEWDPAILALINYPDVITEMNANLDWTEQLGNAIMDQQADVLDMIQQIRAEATATGYLKSDETQQVTQQGETVVIEPAQPDVVYIPDYDPAVVVEQSYATYPPPVYSDYYPSYYAPGATFFAGAMTGAVFAYAFDWNNDDIDIDCCDSGDIDFDRGDNSFERNFENNGDINIGSENTRAKNVDASRFSAEAKAGQGKMKWSPEKAKQKSTTSKQTRAKSAPKGVAPAVKSRPAGGGGGAKNKLPANKQKVSRPGDQGGNIAINRGLGDYQSGKATAKQSNRGQQSLSVNVKSGAAKPQGGQIKSSGAKKQNMGSGGAKKSNAFSGSGSSGKRASAQGSRGSSSLKKTSRPSRSSRR